MELGEWIRRRENGLMEVKGKKKNLFNPNTRSCYKPTKVPNFLLSSQVSASIKSRDEISFRGKDCNTLPGFSGHRPGYSGHGVSKSSKFLHLGPTTIKTNSSLSQLSLSLFLSLSLVTLSPSHSLKSPLSPQTLELKNPHPKSIPRPRKLQSAWGIIFSRYSTMG